MEVKIGNKNYDKAVQSQVSHFVGRIKANELKDKDYKGTSY